MGNRTRWALALAGAAALTALCGGAQAQKVVGRWHGTLAFNGAEAPVTVMLKAKPGGGYAGRFVSPQKTFALKNIKLDHGKLSFSSDSGDYSGNWDERRRAWVGQWIFPMTFVVPRGATQPASVPPIPASPLVLTAGKP